MFGKFEFHSESNVLHIKKTKHKQNTKQQPTTSFGEKSKSKWQLTLVASGLVGRPRCRKVKEFSWSLWLSQRLLLYDVEVNLFKKNHSRTLIPINCYCQHTTECICQCTIAHIYQLTHKVYHWWELPQVPFLSWQKVLLWQTCVGRDKQVFVTTKYIFCHDKNLLWQTCVCGNKSFVPTQIFCHDKRHFFFATKLLSRQAYFCCDERWVFVVTKMILVAAPANDKSVQLEEEKERQQQQNRHRKGGWCGEGVWEERIYNSCQTG